MKTHYHLSDADFEQQFKATTLDPEIFSHEAHLRLAYIHIQKYGVEQAIENICQQLEVYVDHLGETGKYNTTLTVAAVRAVDHFMRRSPNSDFKGLIDEFPELKFEFKRLMECHYGFDIFDSQLAKTTYLEPDLVPFD